VSEHAGKGWGMKRIVWARWMVSIVIAIILNGSLAVTARAVDLRRIVVFSEGTPLARIFHKKGQTSSKSLIE